MNFERVQNILSEKNEPGFRMKQIKQAVFVNLINNWDEATNLSKDLRVALAETAVSSLKPVKILKSADGRVEKALFEMADHEKIEAVLIKSKDE
ncbi:MAG: 23S rRNA (adenine(2503)-C(2))-methyltransferase RlmN, partial [Patescibacteria group bacterium]